MTKLTIHEASLLGIIRDLSSYGASKAAIDNIAKNIKRPAAKKLIAESISAGIMDAARTKKNKFIKTKPVRLPKRQQVDNDMEYLLLAKEYKELTGKHFKRTGQDMHLMYSKLQAIKIRLLNIKKLTEAREKNGPDFNLTGAL